MGLSIILYSRARLLSQCQYPGGGGGQYLVGEVVGPFYHFI